MSMVFALVLLGCADDGTACEKLAQPSEHFASQALCEAGVDMALQSDLALRSDHPTVIARCQRTNVAFKLAAKTGAAS